MARRRMERHLLETGGGRRYSRLRKPSPSSLFFQVCKLPDHFRVKKNIGKGKNEEVIIKNDVQFNFRGTKRKEKSKKKQRGERAI